MLGDPGLRKYPSKSSGGRSDLKLIALTRRMAERNLFRAKMNSDYNDFVARVELSGSCR